ncbi:MAG: hypothetical protein KF694_01840 [Mesorhizobium sp.]|nr:hypothetical protein [Mesorhizobium sp.]
MPPDFREILNDIDLVIAKIAEARSELAKYVAPIVDKEEPSSDEWCDTATASERLNYPQDTIRKAGKKYGFVVRVGGRFVVHMPTAKRYFEREKRNGEGWRLKTG